ncbi:hypothetical protein [Burkholderia stagnalis]|uniref:hypothetical protein n=1 Tax=Burkholderia stagnalis TaxID=1503054 RepID=UPI000F56E66B|nr:hypothetical protein [Burkholderia stagnalis]RQQ54288.1 hypothetical protein DF145_05205 [Burkholderia stagnalis]RQY03947.1 hypothetical protein DF121_08205 [Burkholderia stagnalis]RQY21636.1 hypothetical protein DF115_06420 [Burkholderia stagnalis]RQY32169.1 hypothetical protein DF114_12020 [Burkholderia stagnalis]
MAKRKPQGIFPAPLFGGDVIVCRDLDEWRAACEFFDVEDDAEGFAGRTFQIRNTDTGKRVYLIGVFDRSVATLTHELAHAVFFLAGHVGVDVAAGETNETFCYLLGNLLHEVLPFFGAKTHVSRRKRGGAA